jgi:hypothetical protein
MVDVMLRMPLRQLDEELQMLLQVAEKFETAKRFKGRELNRTEKCTIAGKETENIIRSHLLSRGFNLSKTREFLVDDELGSMEIDLMLLRQGVDPEDAPYQLKDVKVVFEIKKQRCYGSSNKNQS